MRPFHSRSTAAVTTVAALAALALAAGAAAAQTPVYPGDPAWFADQRAGGAAAITGSAPRSGNGSLELSVAGGSTDWAFWLTRVDDPTSGSWGRLADVATLGFDWRRAGAESATEPDAPWRAQTPVLRLHLREDGVDGAPVFSELIWERWYSSPAPAVRDTWTTEDLIGGDATLLWRVYGAAVPGTTVGPGPTGRTYPATDCSAGIIDPAKPLLVGSVADWAGTALCMGSPDAVVWGLSIGVGSNWPLAYTGFVDDVTLAFGVGGDPLATPVTAVSANFELPAQNVVPEPHAVLLLGGGLVALGALSRRRSRTR